MLQKANELREPKEDSQDSVIHPSQPMSRYEGLDSHENNPSLLLVTANVGSLFEDPLRLLQAWIKEFLCKVDQLKPKFLALHLQEVGGKTYEKSMDYVQEFIQHLCEADEMQDFSFIRIYMDEDFNSAEHFTALGNLYFAHKSLENLKIWNFFTHEWEQADGKNIYSGNIETIATKEKSKFPQHFFPECKWSRKGFMRTRWEICGTVIDLVNIHLFHDASNLAACEEFPSVYCKTRRRALIHTLERFHLDDKNKLAPYFLFGDFNFRCDTEGVIKELTENLSIHRVQNIKSDCTKVHYRNSVGDNVLTIGKKEFNHADHQLKFKETWLKKYDRELEVLKDVLTELIIQFPPSYPYEEDPDMPADYMSTRCPSWCDRILMSPQAREIILDHENNEYNVIGENVCMGDHKPIYLHARMKSNQGTYRCCNCCLFTNNNNSASNHYPAVSTNIGICPYDSRAYKNILLECGHSNLSNCNEADMNIVENTLGSSQADYETRNDAEARYPCVSINVINSDNLHVCWCSEFLNSNAAAERKKQNDVDGLSVCSECRNAIKKQPTEHRYRLVSKQVMLSNDIIVNRIDMQYLNAYYDVASRRQDPYTPESAESHSPCPELSTPTTTSSNNRSPCEKSATTTTSNINTNIKLKRDMADGSSFSLDNDRLTLEQQHGGQRGVVTPGQLKSRLEDLKKNSIQSLNVETTNTAGESDAMCEDVDGNCQIPTAHKGHGKHLDQVLANMQEIAKKILGDQTDVWTEQSQVESRSHYIQINRIPVNEDQKDVGAAQGAPAEDGIANECNNSSGCLSDQTQGTSQILKETTV